MTDQFCILIHYHEISLKGKNRSWFERCLIRNIKRQLTGLPFLKIHLTAARIFCFGLDEFKWNELVYKSKYTFKPVQGKMYHLYQKNDDNKDLFLSLIGPDEWDMLFIGSFKLLSNNKWEKIEDE